MNQTEATILVTYLNRAGLVGALEGMAAVWADALNGVRLDDAQEAARNFAVKRTSEDRWVTPGDVRTEVKRIREKRLAETPEPTPPPDLTPAQTIEWLRATRRAIADGNPPDVPALDAKPRNMAALAGTFKRMPEAG